MEKKNIDTMKGPHYNLPRAVFSRPDIPFQCKVKEWTNNVICSFEDYLPMYNEKREENIRYYVEPPLEAYVETITLFFPNDARYIMPPHKVLGKKELYGQFLRKKDGIESFPLHHKFVKRFLFYPWRMHGSVDVVERKTSYLRPVTKRAYSSYSSKEEVWKAILLDDAKYMVRQVIADNPVVRINENNEIIDGPF